MIMQFSTSGTVQILAANTISNTDKFAKVVHPDIGGYPTKWRYQHFHNVIIEIMILLQMWECKPS